MAPIHQDAEAEHDDGMPQQQRAALRALTGDYLELANEVKDLEAKQTVVKESLTALMEEIGITAHKIPGIASLKIRPRTVRYVYDPEALEALIRDLSAENTEYAKTIVERILACRERKTTKSYLMIMRQQRTDE
jgi:hypothetical protein